jgi:hypothetical protein
VVDIHIRGPQDPGPAGNPFGSVIIYGLPDDAEFDAARAKTAAPRLYAVADTAATLVLMGALWQAGTTTPHLKLRGPQHGAPAIIYGIPDEHELAQRRAEARQLYGARTPLAYLIARTAADLIWLQVLWQTPP